jgi:hypothetical protein
MTHEIKWPRHAASLYLEHNDHKNYYQTIEEVCENYEHDWISEEERKKAIETDSVWTLQWYPDTPIGSHCYAASTFEALMGHVMSLEQDGSLE